MTQYPYKDTSLSPQERARDLAGRLTLEEKASMMWHDMLPAIPIDKESPDFAGRPTARTLLKQGANHFNIHGHYDTAAGFVDMLNEVQRVAMEGKEHPVPVTISSDPRHAFSDAFGLSMSNGIFSAWPEHIGLVALRDPAIMRQYADIVRQEYAAVGIRMALHPQIDLSTMYQWSRISGSLGEDAELASELAVAHVQGLQGGSGLQPGSVAACVKHFPGCGTTAKGYDPHFAFGSDLVYPGNHFDYHLKPFQAGVKAGTAVVMTAYGKPIGTEYEEVAVSFNKGLLTGLLREKLGYEGVILSDWGIINDFPNREVLGDIATARSWGVEHLSEEEKILKALNAGVDQFGGDFRPQVIVKLVRDGKYPEEKINESAARLLADKFALGLFENPFVDAEAAAKICGREDFVAAGVQAQKDSLTMLTNRSGTLPLKKGLRVYTENFKSGVPNQYGETVTDVTSADVAIVRLATPYEIIGKGAIAGFFHHGNLEFPADTLVQIRKLAKSCPVIVVIDADRPPVLETLVDDASAILISYGISDAALSDVLFGASGPKGKLPFDLPRSNGAVKAARNDVPFDTKDPVFRFGHGLRYGEAQ